MNKFKTQLQAAQNNIITSQMKKVAQLENMNEQELLQLVAEGKIVIPANKNHTSLIPCGIGSQMRTKINVNIGVSEDIHSIDLEIEKLNLAIQYKADAIMDLSCSGLTEKFRKILVEKSPIPVGTVPVYDSAAIHNGIIENITKKSFFNTVRKHGEDGVDFITIHAGLTAKTVSKFAEIPRVTGIVSRGGAIMFEWMQKTGNENPFYEYFDELCDICQEFDMTLSLGDGLRPGSIADATDYHQISELVILGELTYRARKRGVQVMIEGPGHVPLHEIAANMLIQKKICGNAPFYVLGPLVTDIAPGYDHITSAIGGAIAASHGADFLCYVTPAEHLCLPDLSDVKEGIIASKIAAHAADISKGIKGAFNQDLEMSKARFDLDWEKMINLSIDPDKAKTYRARQEPSTKDACTMCGNLCAVKRFKECTL
ncbi:MAG: phosphomethylpyrimidine synthase [Spirochaetes bacterium GWF1_31_7]|nr:MAG: phosphomethylpyrimidine synthase [Spirochaetes bacterium GWE1_32_154]OHD50036.1 MAG: phosphomethylpyrimidine synthase [Spirochaetes bacterium GWE2_31_10]OHD52350.1 MAG: phosphomethylpyrimidine synthase [Spirochaetes bacterium GWF1_31_7]OHD83166.1 MAG: phosphomethylpyrimidine synthase [Spirochaetes bacterium RIFOXYB1_FULL_32_8]HBD95989.1 thiamine biosynthesis protein ThiC [Spirochaetia bacterium]